MAILAWREAIMKDLGGASSLDMLQNSLLDRATELMIILRNMASYVEKEGVMGADGSLQPCLKTSYIAYVNSFSRIMSLIYERAKNKPPRVPNLEDWIEEQNKKE
jgi:hypothetical protein